MSDTANNVESATEAPKPELKSSDTSVIAALKAKPGAPEPKAPAEKPQAAQPADEAEPPEGENASAAESSEKKEQRLPRWMKERLERERKVTEARTREAVLRELQAVQPAPQRQPEAESPREKTLEDFDFDPSAYQKYLAKQAVEEYKREEQAKAEQAKQAAAAEKFKVKIDSFEAKIGAGAWEDIESSPLNTDKAYKPLVDLFLGDENDLELAHHLAQNMGEADRLMALPALQRAREVAKLADSLSGTAEPPKATVVPPKKVTNAPPPPKTVTGTGRSTPSEDDEGITPDARIALWQAKRRAR